MTNVIRIKRRISGASGAPGSLKSAELAYNMADNTVYIGYGDDGSGNATSVKPIGGEGTFAKLATTLSGYGITDAQPLDADLTAIAGLSGTSGLLKKTAADTWTLDTSTYLTSITSGNVTTALGFTPENSANKGVANGYASLDSGGKVPSSQLPAYVDDVLEYTNLAGFPATGLTGVIYVALDTNKAYRWSGSTYVEIAASPGTTDSVTEGTTNLYFTDARARGAISVSGSLSYNSSTGIIAFTDAVTSVSGKTGAVTLTSSDVGLSNVENTALSTATIDGGTF